MSEDLGKQLRKFSRLKLELAALEESVRDKKAEVEQSEEHIRRMFASLGLKSATLADGRTVHLRNELRVSKAGGVGKEDFHRILRENDLEDFVTNTVSAATLKGYVRECRDSKQEIPEEVRKALNIHEEFRVNVLQKGATLEGEGESE